MLVHMPIRCCWNFWRFCRPGCLTTAVKLIAAVAFEALHTIRAPRPNSYLFLVKAWVTFLNPHLRKWYTWRGLQTYSSS